MFRDAGLLIHISELDVSIYLWREEGSELLPEDTLYDAGLSEEAHERLAQRYGSRRQVSIRVPPSSRGGSAVGLHALVLR